MIRKIPTKMSCPKTVVSRCIRSYTTTYPTTGVMCGGLGVKDPTVEALKTGEDAKLPKEKVAKAAGEAKL